ncbi:MAG TPA: hypothetical protein VMU84_04530, partial [Thermoanaerobaculia bacterium]|nr:hypothetical protein [Thermoanaerobaculia bacterium]
MVRTASAIDEAIYETKTENYLRALTLFIDIYGTEDVPPIRSPKDASGLSYFGLVLALVQRKFKPAIDLCKRAIDLEFYNGDHYMNLTKVYVAAGNRKKAIETAENGMKVAPEHDGLLTARAQLGVRARPALPILDRANPINVSLGRARHAKKVSDEES